MCFLFRLRLLNLFIKVVFPDRHHLAMPMASIPARRSESAAAQATRFVRPPGGVPDFVDDLTDDEIGACNEAFSDAWLKVVDHPDTIANARGFLEEQYRK